MRWPWQRVSDQERIIKKADSASHTMAESVLDIRKLMRRIERLYQIETTAEDDNGHG